MAVTKIKPIKSTLKKALDYIQNPNKTDGKMLVSSFGCSYETADIEFGFTLSQALDRGNNLAHHLIQSFEPGEVDYEKAHEIGKQLADAVTKGQYEYVLTTHIDKGHKPNVPLVSCGRHKGVVIIAAAAGLIDTLYLALSWYFLGVFVSCAAPLPVARSRSRRDRLCNGGSVIVIFL